MNALCYIPEHTLEILLDENFCKFIMIDGLVKDLLIGQGLLSSKLEGRETETGNHEKSRIHPNES